MEHVSAWLQAYHDGELHGLRLQQVEVHLEHCETCREELDMLRSLSALLQENPVTGDLMPEERFVAQVGLRLPHLPERTPRQRALETGWRLLPVGLLGAWAFVQAALIVTSAVLIAQRIGLGGEILTSLLPTVQGDIPRLNLLSTPLSELMGDSREMLNTLGQALSPITTGWTVVMSLAPLLGIGLLYWSWLASWWMRRVTSNE
jgi:hypothetical protein